MMFALKKHLLALGAVALLAATASTSAVAAPLKIGVTPARSPTPSKWQPRRPARPGSMCR